MATVSVRYIVDDVKAGIEFYTRHLGFRVDMHPAPGFVLLAREDLRLMLNEPGVGGAGQAMPDGQLPRAGGWNRIQLRVANLDSLYSSLKNQGARFRNDITQGQGGRQVLLQDPSGNLIELFEAKKIESTVMKPVFSGIFLTAENPPKTAAFYQDVALIKLEQIGTSGGYVYWKADQNGVQIAIHDAGKFAAYTSPAIIESNVTHLYFRIENHAQFLNHLAGLNIKPFAVDEVVITVTDPDGRQVMFGTA